MSGYVKHLFFGYLFCFILLVLFYFLGFNFFSNLLLIFGVVFVFSILPDIDSRSSNASRILHLSSIILVALAGFTDLISNKLFLVFLVLILEFYHFTHARNTKNHRQFPHTFTFGFLSSAILFLLTNSFTALLFGFTSFTSHIILDGYFSVAVSKDKKLFKRIFRK